MTVRLVASQIMREERGRFVKNSAAMGQASLLAAGRSRSKSEFYFIGTVATSIPSFSNCIAIGTRRPILTFPSPQSFTEFNPSRHESRFDRPSQGVIR
jgi:hypothetical protein